ncbi:MAG: alkylphosphonate utilization protein [Alphaproteobacteria bacterium]|nr:alkylphosphonate utilization protein [Alphaproteobacteria bacterium]MCD8519905.1 alkylphosphonate utilization protein [Alphaproteobacteria bacterium]MCD8570884.1 alkylphosphonate utilization protein [Alphaproteobacteria bacterium]
MTTLPPCPKCSSPYVYEDGPLLICPECAHEWNPENAGGEETAPVIKDAVGNILADGDSVTVMKDLKYRGGVVKLGTKVKSIRLVPGASDGHDIDCKIPGVGQMGLKSEFVKKITD